MNRLARESSPYLRQHADNPVDWLPWGRAAFDLARREDRPIFLSIGYSACHWCHVMERESFEDPTVAQLLNAHFVSVKVDREERPDVDAVYMNALQALSGSGGWPLSVFLTPELEPFHGGTYFPPERRWGMPSFRDVLLAVAEAWRDRRQDLVRGAAALVARLASADVVDGTTFDPAATTETILARLSDDYDRHWGGFGAAPKFPAPARLFLLLELAASGEEPALEMLAGTLDGMAAGGMWDWVGGGFHRYSVDAMWLVPHFEKMLYDNALLGRLYGEAGVRLGVGRWTTVARRTADYLVREMRAADGGFYSSTDADSEGEEGRAFTWTPDEIRAELPAGAAAMIIRLCALQGTPNFAGHRWVLRPQSPLSELARDLGFDEGEAANVVERARQALQHSRLRRTQPSLDDKRLAGWNGMAIWALAWLGGALGEPRYFDAACRAADFLLTHMAPERAPLIRSWRDGACSGVETLEDVAWVAAGLLELYQGDGRLRWLRASLDLVASRLPRYVSDSGALYEAPDDADALPIRPRDATDGATMSGVAVMTATLHRLAALTGRRDLAETARRATDAEAATVVRHPTAATMLVQVAAALRRPPAELVVVGDPAWPSTHELLRAGRRSRVGPTIIVPAPAVPVPEEATRLVPLLRGREQVPPGSALAYLCRAGRCSLPVAGPDELGAQLEALGRR